MRTQMVQKNYATKPKSRSHRPL